MSGRSSSAAAGARPQKPQAKTPRPSTLTPELKGFIDRVLAPILVKDYMENQRNEKSDDRGAKS